MARAAATDPIRNFKFRVSISPGGDKLNTYTKDSLGASLGDLGFAVVSGLSVNNELVGYREGGMNTHPHKFVGQSDFAPVTFSRGIFAGQSQMYRWQQFIHSWNQASGASNSTDNNYRCDILVKVYDHPNADGSYLSPSGTGNAPSPGNVRLAFKLFECWPGAFSMSDLNANDSGVMIQQLTVHHEGFVVAWTPEEIDKLPSIG